ncbi:MAG: hypothetical protein QW701_02720 [Candidatus Nezhaarchaeales archaeon]
MSGQTTVEIECPYCHSRIVPKKRFSRLTFAGLMVIGLLPFLIFLVFNVLFMLALSSLLRSMTADTPLELFGLEALISALYPVAIATSIAFLLLVLVIGVVPAIIYWSVRRDTYKCSVCGMAL